MIENLVIVESPAKAKTINKYLGSDYVLISNTIFNLNMKSPLIKKRLSKN